MFIIACAGFVALIMITQHIVAWRTQQKMHRYYYTLGYNIGYADAIAGELDDSLPEELRGNAAPTLTSIKAKLEWLEEYQNHRNKRNKEHKND